MRRLELGLNRRCQNEQPTLGRAVHRNRKVCNMFQFARFVLLAVPKVEDEQGRGTAVNEPGQFAIVGDYLREEVRVHLPDKAVMAVWIDLRQPQIFGEIQYLLPKDRHPWFMVTGCATTIHEAVKLIIEALSLCEQRQIEEYPA
jgi:hypothetical protein